MSRIPLFPPVFAPAVSHPMVDDFSIRASRMRTRQQPQLPTVYPLPMRNHPLWSGNNELGNEVGFAPDANNRQMVLKMEENGFPRTWRVMLGSTYDVPGGANEQRWAVRAEIIAGSGGAVQEFYVDWMEGTTFDVVCNTLVVNATYNDVIVDPGNVPINLRLRATTGWADGAAATAPTVSELLFAEAGGLSTGIVRIPPFARSVSFLDNFVGAGTTSVFATTTRILFSPSPGLTQPAAGVLGDQVLAMGNRVPIPKTARFLLIDNTGANDVTAWAVFSVQP